jgi:hypothetical protein
MISHFLKAGKVPRVGHSSKTLHQSGHDHNTTAVDAEPFARYDVRSVGPVASAAAARKSVQPEKRVPQTKR